MLASLPVLALLFWVLVVCPLTGRALAGAGLDYGRYLARGATAFSTLCALLMALLLFIVPAVHFYG